MALFLCICRNYRVNRWRIKNALRGREERGKHPSLRSLVKNPGFPERVPFNSPSLFILRHFPGTEEEGENLFEIVHQGEGWGKTVARNRTER